MTGTLILDSNMGFYPFIAEVCSEVACELVLLLYERLMVEGCNNEG